MANLKRSTLTPEEKDRRRKRVLTLGGATALVGSLAAFFFLAKPTQTLTPPVDPIINKPGNIYTKVIPPEQQPPKSMGDVIISPPEIDMGQITVGQDHYTGSFNIKIAGVSAKIKKIEFPFAQQTGLKIDTSACPTDSQIEIDQTCPISFIFDPTYPGRVDTQVMIQAQLELSNSSTRLQTATVHIVGEAIKQAPPTTPVAQIPQAGANNNDGLSDDALSYLRRRQRPGQLDRQFDPASYTYETAQDPKQDNWRSVNYGPNYSSMPVDMTRVVTMDKPIPAVIKIPIDSRHPSRAVATVERDIYGGDGRLVIIERGSTLIGSAASLSNPSEEKVAINWERIVRPDGSAWALAATSGDAMGRSGAIGIVDRRWLDRFGVTLAVSAVSAGLNIALNASQTTTIGASGTSTTSSSPSYLAMQQFQGDFRTIFSEFAKEQLAIPPIITVPAGTRITVYPTTDLWLRPINPTEDMRFAYARQQKGSDAYQSAQAKASSANAAMVAGDRQTAQSQQGSKLVQPYIQNAAENAGAAVRPGVALTPVASPAASQDPWIASDSVTSAPSGQAAFQNGKSTTDSLKSSVVVTAPNPMSGGYGGYGNGQSQYSGAPVSNGYQSQPAAPTWSGAVIPQQ